MTSHYREESESRYFSSTSQEQQPQRRMYIERNSEEGQDIVIPHWDEESSSHYHLLEELKLLKKKNHHFEMHMGRMKQEYEQIRAQLEDMDEKEKEYILKNNDLLNKLNAANGKVKELKQQVQIC